MSTGSLCSGYEGLGMAVQSVLGGDLAWVADNDPGASAILAHRFPGVLNLGDISATRWDEVEPVEILTAGFPCQDVSCAGARKGLRKGNRTGVWSHVAEAIGALRPPLVLLENVRGLLTFGADSNLEPCPWCMGDSGDESVLRACGAVLADLADLGFDAEWALVSAAAVGAPHRRERVFILAWPAADTTGPERRRDGAARPASCRTGIPAEPGHVGFLAADTDLSTGGERRIAAPGEAESGRPRTDVGGRGGAPAADAERGDRDGGAVEPFGGPDRRAAADRDSSSGNGRPAAADAICPELPREREPGRRPGGRTAAAGSGADATADTRGARLGQYAGEPPAEEAGPLASDEPSDSRGLRPAVEWGPYALAIRRWEHATGRPAPRPTEPGRTGERLSPRFVEWMMGLPEGWVTDVPGLSRNAQLKALGNGVVPQQAAMALRLLLDRAGIPPLVAADPSLTETEGDAA